MVKHYGKRIITFGVTTLALVWLFEGIEWEGVKNLGKNIEPWWLITGVGVYCLAYAARALRFQTLLPNHAIQFRDMAIITAIHNFAVRALPNPIGELAFLHETKKKNVDYPSGIAALIVYRAFDFIVIALMLLGALIPLLNSSSESIEWFVILTIAALLCGIGLIAAFSFPKSTDKIIKLGKLIPRVGQKIEEKLSRLTKAFKTLRERNVYEKTLFYSIGVWSAMFLSYICFFKAFGVEFSLRAVVLGGTIQILANTIPNIGGVGVMEAGWFAGLSLVGIPKEIALPAALGVDLITLAGTILLGLLAITVQYGSIKEFHKIEKQWQAS